MYGATAVASKEDLNLPYRRGDVLPESNSNLLRYQSAPSSLLGELRDDFLPHIGDKTSGGGAAASAGHGLLPMFHPQTLQTQLKQQQQQQQMTNHVFSGGMDMAEQFHKRSSSSNPNFARQSSSPAGLFSAAVSGNSPEESVSFGGAFRGNNNYSAWEINSSLELQNGDRNPQFSSPNTSSEMVNLERYWEFQDAMPSKVRAKRGCATHPRSIAERVRRTRISERIRKLQELVPNMDKQTNTSDMLDLAVGYIKDLQKQVKVLSEKRASCSCSAYDKQQQISN